jgi:hypothetical protein
MPQLSRHYCTLCKKSIYNVEIDGQRIPLVAYFVVGQPADTGDPLDVNADGVKLPSFVRELMQTPGGTQRVELCIACLADVFGLALVTAADDPMYDVNNNQIADAREIAQGVDQVEAFHRLHFRALHAIKVGRGAAQVSDLPAEFLPPASPAQPDGVLTDPMLNMRAYLDTLSPEAREAAIAELSTVGAVTVPQ